MGATSTAVKRKYNQKTYKRFTADLRIDDFEKIEKLRADMSRAEFLKYLAERYADERKNEDMAEVTVTIPQWLNEAAAEKNINFSQVLQDALKEELNII